MSRKHAGPIAGRRSEGSRPKPRSLSLVVICPAVLLLKMVVMWQLKDHVLTQPDAGLDTTTYVTLAQRVVGGDTALGPGLYFVSPLYIYFLASVLAVTGSFTAVRVLQILLGTAAVACVYVAADEWYGRRAAWLAATLAALTGLFTFYESLLIQAALDPFLTAAGLATLALGLRRNRDRWYIAAGLLLGVQTLNRPNLAIVAFAITMCLVATRHLRAAGVFAVAMMLALAPVAVRNAALTGTWSPVSSHGGLNFYIGNNAEADGTYRSVAGITPNLEGQQEDARRVAEQAAGRALDDAAVSAHFYRSAWNWIRGHPAAAAELFVRKLSLVFSSADIWLNYSYPFFKFDARTALRVLFVGPWILLPLGLVGLIVAAPKAMRREYLIWVSFVPMYAWAVAMFFVADRYTLPLLVPLCVAGGAAIDAFAHALSGRQWSRLAIGIVLVGALGAVVNRPVSVEDGVAESRLRMAERLITLGRYDEAEQWTDRAEKLYPLPGLVHFRVGQRLLSRDRTEAAIAHFEKALRFDPGQPEVELVLGETLLSASRPTEAAGHLRRAFDAGFHADIAGYDLVRALGAIGDRVEAVRVLRQLAPAQEQDADYWIALGDLGIKLQEPALAATFFRKAIQARPEFAAAHLGMAVSEANLGLISEALQHAEEALRLQPDLERARQLQQLLRQRTR